MTSEISAVQQHPHRYQFGDFELVPLQGALWRDGVRVPVMPKPMAALIVLVEHAGGTVSKEDLLAQVWNGAAVEENNVTQTISALRKILGEKRGENRFIATEPGSGYRFVAPVRKIVSVPLAATPEPSFVPASPPVRRSFQRFYILAGALLLLIAGAALWLRFSRSTGFHRTSVAVLGIRDLSKTPSEAWLQTALPEMLTSELASEGKLHTIPADDVVRWRSGLGTSMEKSGNAGLLRLAHRNFDADQFVLGSYVVTGACPDCRVRVDLGVFDAHTGESLAAVIDEAPAPELLDLTARLGARLRDHFGIHTARSAPLPWPASSAMREYAEGLNAFRRIDPMSARDHLLAAEQADPGNALIHSALADAWTSLGYASRAADESRRAYELSSSLNRLDQLGIEARYRANTQQWNRAIEIDQSLFRLFPDSLEDGLNLARAQFRAMQYSAAIATLQTLRRLPRPAGNDPRIDLLDAQCAGAFRDYMKTRDLARRAALEAKSRGALYLYARARLLEGGAMQTMGDLAFSAIETDARQVCEQLGDRQCVASAWRIRGNELFVSGKFHEAQDAYLQGASVARDLGDNAELANILNGLGVVAESNLEWDQAEKSFSEAIALKKETGYNPSEVQVQLAVFYLRIGRLADAARASGEAFSSAQQTNAREEIGEVYLVRSELARLEGRLPAAQELAEKSVDEFRKSKSVIDLTAAFATLSSICTARGDLQKAASSLTEAGKTGDDVISDPEGQGLIDLARAQLLLANDQFQQAADVAKRAAAHFSTAHLHEDASRAWILQADALDRLGKTAAAIDASRQAQQESAQSPDPTAIAAARLTAWRLAADSNQPADLHSSIAALKNPELSLEEDLARAIHARRSGLPNAARLFDSLSTRAAAAGYLTLSRRARALGQ